MWQDSPRIKMIGVKVSQELFRLIEKRVLARRMKDVSQLARFVLEEEAMLSSLTSEDKELIIKRIKSAEAKIAKRQAKKGSL